MKSIFDDGIALHGAPALRSVATPRKYRAPMTPGTPDKPEPQPMTEEAYAAAMMEDAKRIPRNKVKPYYPKSTAKRTGERTERRKQIFNRMRGWCTTKQIAAKFEVGKAAINTDLRALVSAGLLQRESRNVGCARVYFYARVKGATWFDV
jgi:pyruvate-formate lyase